LQVELDAALLRGRDRDQLDGEAARLKRQNEQLEKELQALRDQIEALRRAAAEDAYKVPASDLAAVQAKLRAAEGETDDERGRVRALAGENAALQAELDRTRAAGLADAAGKVPTTELDALRRKAAAEAAQAGAALAALQAEMDRLRAVLVVEAWLCTRGCCWFLFFCLG
jgi:predicted RNase H-like nuclease (RuvC/YqgF family)